jgi:putative Mg2+ transporter-C (MgtC) family protein
MMLDDHPILDSALRMLLAILLALPVGWEREYRSRSAGLRTYPLLSACVCGFLLLAQNAGLGPGEQADVFYGVLSGIGFVGSGAIVKTRRGAHGLNTAVSFWVTGAIGVGAAFRSPVVSGALSLMTVLMLRAPSLVMRRRGTS